MIHLVDSTIESKESDESLERTKAELNVKEDKEKQNEKLNEYFNKKEGSQSETSRRS